MSVGPLAALALAPGDRWFAGHFPDRPILPGITALWLAVESLARETGVPPVLQGIASARLKRLVLPGETLTFHARETAGGRHRLELRVGDEVAAQADVRLGEPHSIVDTAAFEPIVGAPPAPLPALDDLLPHRPPMRFPTRVNAVSEDGLAATAKIPGDCALVGADGCAPVLACVEAAAQAAALWEGVRRATDPSAAAGPRIGYLVALRDLAFGAATVAADVPFDVAVRLDAVALPLTHYRIEASLDGRKIVAGRVATVLAPDA